MNQISAKIIKDSIYNGNRITTFEVTYPRMIHSEIMTHRVFSRNAASSRAIPIDKYIEMIEQSPAQPVEWGLNKAGMQAEGVHSDPQKCASIWKRAAQYAVQHARILQEEGLHKQIVNRLLEPFMTMKTIITTTEIDNFFWLRNDSEADPTLQALARGMVNVFEKSVPDTLQNGEWHLPYVDTCREFSTGRLMYVTELEDGDLEEIDLETAIKISCSCCAQVSYRKLDDSVEKAMDIYNKLVNSRRVHASALEHCATPILASTYDVYGNETWPDGATHRDVDDEMWSGNFRGWVQYRQLIPNHTCYDYKQ